MSSGSRNTPSLFIFKFLSHALTDFCSEARVGPEDIAAGQVQTYKATSWAKGRPILMPFVVKKIQKKIISAKARNSNQTFVSYRDPQGSNMFPLQVQVPVNWPHKHEIRSHKATNSSEVMWCEPWFTTHSKEDAEAKWRWSAPPLGICCSTW